MAPFWTYALTSNVQIKLKASWLSILKVVRISIRKMNDIKKLKLISFFFIFISVDNSFFNYNRNDLSNISIHAIKVYSFLYDSAYFYCYICKYICYSNYYSIYLLFVVKLIQNLHFNLIMCMPDVGFIF